MDKIKEKERELPSAKKLQKGDIKLLKELHKVFHENGYKGRIRRVVLVIPKSVSVDPMADLNCWQFCFSAFGETICTWECWKKGEG